MIRLLFKTLFLVVSIHAFASSELPEPNVTNASPKAIFASTETAIEALGTLVLSVFVASLSWRTYKELIDPTYKRMLETLKLKCLSCCRRVPERPPTISLEQV